MKQFSVVIVTKDSEAVISSCLRSIEKNVLAHVKETVVVDNDSHDQTLGVVSQFPWVTLITKTENQGFARSVNEGVKATTGEYVLLLNPDIEFEHDFFPEIVRLFHERKDIGIIGPRITFPDGTLQPSVRRFPTLLSQIIMFLKLDHIYGGFRSVQSYLATDFDYRKPQYAPQVMGACFFTTRTLWHTLGGMDEQFFIWFEEVDFCLRARNRGVKTFFTPAGSVRHALGHSFAEVPLLKKQCWFLRSMVRFFVKHGV